MSSQARSASDFPPFELSYQSRRVLTCAARLLQVDRVIELVKAVRDRAVSAVEPLTVSSPSWETIAFGDYICLAAAMTLMLMLWLFRASSIPTAQLSEITLSLSLYVTSLPFLFCSDAYDDAPFLSLKPTGRVLWCVDI